MGELEQFAQRGMAAQEAVDTEIAKHYGPGPWLVIVRTADGRAVAAALTESLPTNIIGCDDSIISLPRALAADDLFTACQQAADFYDALALGPLDAAAKYGPDWEPPTDEQLLELRSTLNSAIAKATKI